MVFAFLNFIIHRYHFRLCHERIQSLFRHPFLGHLLTEGRQQEVVEQLLQAGEWKSVLLIIIILFKKFLHHFHVDVKFIIYCFCLNIVHSECMRALLPQEGQNVIIH
jgi:hypothetical protein